jgi:hypothetical protein
MVDAPQQNQIQNVLAMHEPQHMLAKLLWEIRELTTNMSVWVDNEEFPVAIFTAFNAAVTAWHITDWIWQSSPEARAKLAKRFNFEYQETRNGIRTGLERFQEAVAKECRALYVCREIANGSKHMRKARVDPDVKTVAEWHKAIVRTGVVNSGDLVMSMNISGGNQEKDAIRWFIEAFGYWENLFRSENWISIEKRLPDKIIRAKAK